MKVRYLGAADAEFQETIDYYNEQRNALAAAKSIDFPTASFTKYAPIRS